MKCITIVYIFVLAGVPLVFTEPKVEIEGPTHFTTDGTRDLTLNAAAKSLGDDPYYGWAGLCSSHTKTCTFRPQRDQDGGQVICTATDSRTAQSAATKYVVKLNCPPVEAPQIKKSTTRDVLTSGDVITCTVFGGKPLVTSVNLTCTSHSLPDQDFVISSDSVSSNISVDASRVTEGSIVCKCSAIWEPELALYNKEQTMTFAVEMPSVTGKVSSSTDRMASSANAENNTVVIVFTTSLLILTFAS